MDVDKNFVPKTVKWVISLLKNKVIASLVLLVQGILFIIMPNGDMTGTVRIAAAVLAVASLINIIVHLIAKEKTLWDYILIGLSILITAVSVFFFIFPDIAEPYMRTVIAIITIVMNLVNIVETVKIEKKFNWKMALGLIVGVIMIGLGVAMMIATKDVIEKMQMGIGGFLILNSLVDIWYIIRMALIVLHDKVTKRKAK